jgi:4-hydroxy-3-polyprenylbenzoate decarboxylase
MAMVARTFAARPARAGRSEILLRKVGLGMTSKDKPTTQKRLIVGISGASGVIYGVRLLEALRGSDVETHLVISKAAEMAFAYETDLKPAQVRKLAHKSYAVGDMGAAISSGSFKTMGMIVLPCSIKTMSEVATGVTGNLLSRAADVVLKERRRLVIALRETPLHAGHLRNLATLSDLGAVTAPLVPAFYPRPSSVDDIINHSVGRLLDLFDIETDLVNRWQGKPR